MRTFENPTEIYIPIFERDTRDWLDSSGAFSPEIHLESATKEAAEAFIKARNGEYGEARIAKLRHYNDESENQSGPVFVMTESDGVENKPIVWERIGSNLSRVLSYQINGMKSPHGRVKFMVIDSIEKVEL